MYKLEFQLTQHTPIIHFQSGYEGATLRASEVKPKLDRYLLRELKKEKLDADWFISQEKGALDYKLRFTLPEGESVKTYLPLSRLSSNKVEELKRDLRRTEELREVEILPSTPYFANEEWLNKREGQPRLAIQVGRVRGEIYTKHPKLREAIETHLEAFFLLHNFGARQTKGFGSFTLHSVDDKIIMASKKRIATRMYHYGVEDYLQSKADVRDILQTITEFHCKIKTGEKGSLSELRKFFHKAKMEWEKPLVRTYIGLSEEDDTEPYKKYYLRALLGLHGQFEFPQLDKKVRVSHDEIKRFASPITYKPINDTIYLIISDIPPQMFGTEFRISLEREDATNEVLNPIIKTPPERLFEDASKLIFDLVGEIGEGVNPVNKLMK